MMKISEFAAFTQRSPRALRLYEELGLLTPHERTQGGFRLYHADQATRLTYIDKLQALGCSLTDIQKLIKSWQSQSNAAQGMHALKTVYLEKLEEVRAALKQLQQVEQELIESISFLQGCHDCTVEVAPDQACSQCNRNKAQVLDLIRGISEPSFKYSN